MPIPLFDLGNVIVKVDFDPFVEWLTARSEERDEAKVRLLLRSSLFYDLEFGHISRTEFARRLRSLYRAEFSQEELEENFCGIFPGLVPGMVELLEELTRAGPVYCLSNTNEIHLEWLKAREPDCLRHFTRVFASHEVGLRKPYPGIYRGVAESLGVAPGELVFFDDVHANVEGALRAGLDAHVFSEAGQVRSVLKGTRGLDDRS
jgi:HAD superfamily hydrolase (TIGR01509 family)